MVSCTVMGAQILNRRSCAHLIFSFERLSSSKTMALLRFVARLVAFYAFYVDRGVLGQYEQDFEISWSHVPGGGNAMDYL